MRSTATFVVGVFALASSAVAQKAGWAVVTSPAKDQQVPTGQSFNIEWTPGKAKGPVTISLMGGKDQGSQQTIGDLLRAADSAFILPQCPEIGVIINRINILPPIRLRSGRSHTDTLCVQGGDLLRSTESARVQLVQVRTTKCHVTPLY